MIENVFAQLPGGVLGAFFLVMLVIFLLGFILDFIEIIFVVVPIVGPVLLSMGLDPVWLEHDCFKSANLIFNPAVWLFLVLFTQRYSSVCADHHDLPWRFTFIGIQLSMLVIAYVWPELITWLPNQLYGGN